MEYLIDIDAQRQIALAIDQSSRRVLRGWVNHGNEEAMTSALGQELSSASFELSGLKVSFNYRQLNKQTEEVNAGADGGFLVKVDTPNNSVKKAALFQAKKLTGSRPARSLSMNTNETNRLIGQAKRMLRLSDESVAVFYTEENIYVVDAGAFDISEVLEPIIPLSKDLRLITLGTYLGKWLPRCTRGDQSQELVSRVEHLDGFREGITMEVISTKPSIDWNSDPEEYSWRQRS